MARKKVISYGAMASMAVAGGLLSVAAVVAIWLLPEPGPDGAAVLTDVIGTLGTVAWLLGAAAGVLAISTPFARRAIVGLAMCGVTLALVLARAIAVT